MATVCAVIYTYTLVCHVLSNLQHYYSLEIVDCGFGWYALFFIKLRMYGQATQNDQSLLFLLKYSSH
jgi:hypothetical protein